jgi:uncharacterized protein
VLDEALGLDSRQCAILAVLMLRGPQTLGELRTRTERMARFGGLDEVEHELDLLGSRDEPLAQNVGRRPGQKEERWASPLVAPGDPDPGPIDVDVDTDAVPPPAAPRPAGDVGTSLEQRVEDMHEELTGLRSDVARLRQDLDALRDSLGG